MSRYFFGFMMLFLISCSNNNEVARDLNNSAVAYLDKENYEEAAIELKKAWILNDVDANLKADISRNIALCFNQQNERDSALYYARKAIEVSEKDSYTYWVSRAEFALMKQNINEARAWFEKAKELNSEEMSVYNNLGMIYSGKFGHKYENLDLAISNNKKAYELAKREPLGEALAFSYMNAERYTEAIPVWKELQTMAPANMEYVFHEGVCLYFSGKEEEGEKLMEKAADRDDRCREMLEEMY